MNLQEYFKQNDFRKANEYKVTTEVDASGGVRVVIIPVGTGREEDRQHFVSSGNHMTYIGKNLFQAQETKAPDESDPSVEPETPNEAS